MQLTDKQLRRFWAQVDQTNGPVHPTCGRCWVWLGQKNRNGYGRLEVGKKLQRAHRVVWMHYIGDIPPGLCVLHECDNPSCVNPAHLFVGTVMDNQADMVVKGRQARGEDNGRAKLTEEQVLEIRRRYRKGVRGCGAPALAREFGVTIGTLRPLLARKTWAHLRDEAAPPT